jgi:hypothetical protein
VIKKLHIAALCLLGLIYVPVYSQKINGIFLTSSDYFHQKLSYTATPTYHVKIKLNELFNKPYFTIKTTDSTIRLNKDSVFGLCEDKNIFYRIYLKERFKILNKHKTILLYAQTGLVQIKSFPETDYFFSVSINSEILPLTIWNLKKAYPDDSAFHDLLDANFKYDSELTDYDFFHGKYKINYLFDLIHP